MILPMDHRSNSDILTFNPEQNNVLSADIHYNLDHQPSVVVMEANTTGDGQFHLSTVKGIAINVLTAYATQYDEEGNETGIAEQKGVAYAIAALTQYSNTHNYNQSPLNQQLFDRQANILIDTSVPFSQPYYTNSPNAHNGQEAMIAAAEYLADCQDKYVEMVYEVQDWIMPGTNYIWQPDCICNVTEDILLPSNGKASSTSFPMWIRKVDFMQSKDGGTTTKLTLTLPYTKFLDNHHMTYKPYIDFSGDPNTISTQYLTIADVLGVSNADNNSVLLVLGNAQTGRGLYSECYSLQCSWCF